MQRARILLPLAWLVRVNDTQTHRGWLQTAVDGLLTLRYCPVCQDSVSPNAVLRPLQQKLPRPLQRHSLVAF